MLTFDCHKLNAALTGWCHRNHAVVLTIHRDGSVAGVVHCDVTRFRPVLSLRTMHIVLAGRNRCWLTVWGVLGNGTCATRLWEVHAGSTNLCTDHHVRGRSRSCGRHYWEVDSSTSDGRRRQSWL
jgi:hypothetical protein